MIEIDISKRYHSIRGGGSVGNYGSQYTGTRKQGAAPPIGKKKKKRKLD